MGLLSLALSSAAWAEPVPVAEAPASEEKVEKAASPRAASVAAPAPSAKVGGVCAPGAIAAPATSDGLIRPAMALDINPDPNIVEIELTARPAEWDFGTGNLVQVWTYNGLIPGPTIEAKVGDTLIVHFCNDLPEQTTIHWHGLETPANMDGSHISQLTVPPGGTFRYEIPLIHAGTFWYHPHFRTWEQVEKGLYAALIVRDPVGEADLDLPEPEHIVIVDDILLDENGQIREPFVGTREEIALEQLNGREGNFPLWNGMVRPTVSLEKGIPHRMRLINASSSRFIRMAIEDHPFWRIGGDQGLIEEPIEIVPVIDNEEPPPGEAPGAGSIEMKSASGPEVDGTEKARAAEKHDEPNPGGGIFLTPGERADLLFFLEDTGRPLDFRWFDTARGRHSVIFNPNGTVTLGHDVPDGNLHSINYAKISLFGESTATEYAPPTNLTELQAIDTTGAPELPLVMGHTPPNWETGQVVFFIQAMGKPFMALTPDDVHTVDVGGTYIWSVRNLTGGTHNFHTHGWSFQHIETEWVDNVNPENSRIEPATHLEWKDTFVVPARPGSQGSSFTIGRFAVHFSDTGRRHAAYAGGRHPTENRSGGWLAHCHILEHSALGMMTYFQTSGIFVNGFETSDLSDWSAFTSAAPVAPPATAPGTTGPVAAGSQAAKSAAEEGGASSEGDF